MSVARSVSPSARPRSNWYRSLDRVKTQMEIEPTTKPRANIVAGSKTSMRRILPPITTKRATKTSERPKIWLSAKTRDDAFVNPAGDAHVVEVVFADLFELARLVQIKHLAAFYLGR